MGELSSERVQDMAGRVGAAVVAVGRGGRGAGVVVAQGRVLTAAHNLRDRTTSVRFADGREEQASVTAADVDGDLAVLEVPTGDVEAPSWADEPPALGASVVALARPTGDGIRATVGRVSATDQSLRGPRGGRISGAVEHTAPLARGSTGGPLLDSEGRLAAMNLARVGDGFTLSLPATIELRGRIEALGRGEQPQRRRIGVGLAPPEVADRLRRSVGLPERGGLLVRQVREDSPAARAGLAEGDLLLRAGDRDLDGVEALQEATRTAEGDLVLMVLRGTEELQVTVSFDEPGETTEV